MTYVPTGYKPGRPRKGEVRPASPNAIAMAEYRARRKLRDPTWLAKLAADQRRWYHANLERGREISRGVALRKKRWAETEAFLTAGAEGSTGSSITLTVANQRKLLHGYQHLTIEDHPYDDNT